MRLKTGFKSHDSPANRLRQLGGLTFSRSVTLSQPQGGQAGSPGLPRD